MFPQPHGKILCFPAFELELVFDFYSFVHLVAGTTISGIKLKPMKFHPHLKNCITPQLSGTTLHPSGFFPHALSPALNGSLAK
jgi:hypothetical protein